MTNRIIAFYTDATELAREATSVVPRELLNAPIVAVSPPPSWYEFGEKTGQLHLRGNANPELAKAKAASSWHIQQAASIRASRESTVAAIDMQLTGLRQRLADLQRSIVSAERGAIELSGFSWEERGHVFQVVFPSPAPPKPDLGTCRIIKCLEDPDHCRVLGRTYATEQTRLTGLLNDFSRIMNGPANLKLEASRIESSIRAVGYERTAAVAALHSPIVFAVGPDNDVGVANTFGPGANFGPFGPFGPRGR